MNRTENVNLKVSDDENLTVLVKNKAWANDLLRWFLKEVLYADCWKAHPYCKLLVAFDVIDRLESYGFVWQASRVRNHVHRWMKTLSCKAGGLDSLPWGEGEDSF